MTDQINHEAEAPLLSHRIIWKYCAWIFLASWGMQIVALIVTNGLDDPKMSWWLAGTMLTPAIVTLSFLKFNPALRPKLLWKSGFRLVTASIVGVLVPTAMAFIVLLIFEYLNWGNSQWFNFLPGGVNISGGPFLLGTGSQSWIVFALNIIVTGIAYALLNSLFAAGEEIAWRGLLQGLLIDHLGKWKGILLLGLLWSMWHLPIQLAGYNYPENPLIGSVIISPLLMIGYSIYMAWITLYSKSFIPSAISHGAINGIQEGITAHMDIVVPEVYVYLARVVAVAIVALVFAVMLKKIKQK